jgi:dTDP-6-deoxy-L-lyxo-4-hexulose reductase RmlD-like protein
LPKSTDLLSSSSPLVQYLCLYYFNFEFALIRSYILDYVFDGNSPPYVPSAQTNPVNLYAITKRDAELAVLGVEGARVVVLRVPILCVFASTVVHRSRMTMTIEPMSKKCIVDTAQLRQTQNRRLTS